jgi:branched-chain amino acid transport system substrate-binding protein
VPEVAGVAQSRNVNVVSFSNDRTVAAPGVFIMGLPPSEAVARSVAYARAQGVTRFAALLPSDALGNRIGAALKDTAAKLDAEVTRIEYYDPGAADASNAVKRVADFERRRAAFISAQPAAAQTRAGRNQSAGDPGFQALVMADGGQRLRTIAPLLPFYDIDPAQVHIIGTPAWEDQSLAAEPALVGAWFAAPDPAGRADFERKYREAYARSAPRIASLAYDATGLAAVLARLDGGPDFSAAMLGSPSGFAGVDGIFRFAPDGVVERGLAVLQLERRAIQVISPAPASFEPAVQ